MAPEEWVVAVLESFVNPQLGEAVVSLVRAAIVEEREACATLADNPYADPVAAINGEEPRAVGERIAKAIRSRGAP